MNMNNCWNDIPAYNLVESINICNKDKFTIINLWTILINKSQSSYDNDYVSWISVSETLWSQVVSLTYDKFDIALLTSRA